MTRIANRLAMAGLLLAVSCSGSSGILTLGVSYTLQGIIADAVTGQRLGGDLKLYLIQGPEVRGPSRLITGTSDPLMGEYAFTGIPVTFAGFDGTPSNTWKVVAIRSGYQRFESEIVFSANTVRVSSTADHVILDQAYSKIGNIYLFPTGVTSPDYAFSATYNGKPVPGATVLLDPISASNEGTFTTGSTLSANNGYVPSLSATTDAAGKAAFAGTLLSVGAKYNIQVLPVIFKDTPSGAPVQLRLLPDPTGAKPAFIAGLDNVLQSLTLIDLSAATSPEPLFIADASNRVLNQLQPNGTLVVTFSTPVTLVNPNGFIAALTAGTKADGTTAGTAALNSTQPVTASLSADGLTLTLAPNYTGGGGQAPGATDRGVFIQYGNGTGRVVPKDYPAGAFAVLTPGPGGGVPVLNTAFKMPDTSTTETGFVVIAGP